MSESVECHKEWARIEQTLIRLESDVSELKSDIKEGVRALTRIDVMSERVTSNTARIKRIEAGLLSVIGFVLLAVLGAVLTVVLKQ